MAHRLVPKFILDQLAHGRLSGSFHTVSLFVDVSGFTPLATALMEYSTEGAEVIAEVLGAVFEPLVDIIYAYGGFVATFAGDAFTAFFPTDTSPGPLAGESVYLNALLAAWHSSQIVKNNASQTTRFGEFSFATKISIADGLVDWEIWQSAGTPAAQHWPQRATYCFIGEALDRCFAADAVVPAGGILLTAAVYAQLPPQALTVHPFSSYQQLIAVADSFANQLPTPVEVTPSHAFDSSWASHFFPTWLLARTPGGEFRQTVAMFINLIERPTGAAGKQFHQALFQYLAQYGGYLCSVGRIGDQDQACTILLFWGAPTSYENNVLRALRFVLDLRRVAPIPIRVGVTYHLAYAGFIGAVQRAEYTCYGVHVALAARQMAAARRGEIVLDDLIATQARKDFHLIAHGQRKFKGFIEERPIYLLDRPREQVDEAYDRVPFVDREDELTQLSAHLQRIWQGQFGGVVVITGEAGMGKSRLLREFKRLLEAPSSLLRQATAEALSAVTPTWFYCRTDEILRLSLNPFRYLLYHYFNQSSTQDVAYNQQRFIQKMDELIAATVDPGLAVELARTRFSLAALIGLPGAETYYQQLDPGLRLAHTFNALKTLFKAESCRRPLIIHLEDAHWLDAESQLFLEKLVPNLEGYPLLLVITMRPASGAKVAEPALVLAAAAKPRTVLPLQPLSKANLSLLATWWLDGAITPALLDLLAGQAKGSPFFAEEMLFYWQEQELLQWGDQGWELELDEAAPYREKPSSLSPDVRTILTARLDHLPPTVKTVVQTAAVLGDEFPQPVLFHMLQQAGLPADQITLAAEAGIWRTVDRVTYRFHHTLLCDAAYAMQSRAQLEKLHQQAARAIIALYHNDLPPYYATLVYHYYRANDQTKEQRYARLAGIYAAANYLNQDAIRYFDRALALTAPAELTARYELILAREAVHQWLGDRQAQWQDILLQLTIAQTTKQQQWQAAALLKKADYERATGQYDAAIVSSQAAAALATQLGNQTLQAQAAYIWGRVLRHQGDHHAAHQQLQQALQGAQRTAAILLAANCLHEIGHLYYVQGAYDEAGTFYSQAEAIYQQADDQRGQVNCLLMFGAICYGKGRFVEAEQLYQKALTIARTLGWLPGEASCLSNLGNTYYDVGDYATAHAYHQEALQRCQEIGDREGEAVSLDTLGLITHRQGDLAAAQRYYTSALAIQQELGDQHGEAYTQTHLGYTWLAKAEFPSAHNCFQSALATRQRLGEEGAAIDSLAGLAFAQWQAGDLPAGLAAVLSILAQLAAMGTDGLESPVQIYLICYQLLQAAAADQPQYHQVAQTTLAAAYELVQQRAAQITDANLQRLFLTAVPANATVVALWTKGQSET